MSDPTPIPDHLARLDWYAPHLAWLASQGIVTRHAVPEGTAPKRADLHGADIRYVDLRCADLRGAIGIPSEEEEDAVVAAAIEAIAADLDHWDQEVWHGPGYKADTAPEVGACGSAHCLAGWMQAQLPLGDPRRAERAEVLGWRLAPRRAAAGWFNADTHPDLQAAVDAAVARRAGVSDV